MGTIFISEEVALPPSIVDHASFRRWARSSDYPERGKVSYLNGDIWVDTSTKKLIHNLLMTLITSTVFSIASERKLGNVLGDRMIVTNVEAGLSTEPDGLFISDDSLETGRVRLSEGPDSLEVEGSPDQVLEVVSKHSVKKDTVVLPSLYWAAGIREYWLVDSLKTPATLTIFTQGRDGYQTVRKQGAWQKSPVFGASFRLQMEDQSRDLPTYRLDYK